MTGHAWMQWGVVGVILVTLLLSGPGGVNFASERPSLDDGTATVEVVAPGDEPIYVTDGRFGTGVSYVRIPDLVVDVTAVEGSPRVYYDVSIPELGIEGTNTKILESTGRVRIPLRAQALPESRVVETEARLLVRVQSFSGEHIVLNRTVEVRVRG